MFVEHKAYCTIILCVCLHRGDRESGLARIKNNPLQQHTRGGFCFAYRESEKICVDCLAMKVAACSYFPTSKNRPLIYVH